MLSTICLFLCVVSVHSLYDVNVTVSEFCLDIYLAGYEGAELYMDLRLTSASQYYVYLTEYYYQGSRTLFKTSDNLLSQNGLLLGTPNLFSNIQSLDDFDIVLSIVPILINTKSSEKKSVEKCPDKAVQLYTVSPRDLFQNNSTTKYFEFDLSGISCFRGAACPVPKIITSIEFDCHGPCSELLVITTTPVTYAPTTIPTIDSPTTTSAAATFSTTPRLTSRTTKLTSRTSRSTSATTGEPGITTTTAREAEAGKNVGGMAGIGVLAALELIIIIGLCCWLLKIYKPDLLKRGSKRVNPTTETDPVIYYDGADHWITGAPEDGCPSVVNPTSEPDPSPYDDVAVNDSPSRDKDYETV